MIQKPTLLMLGQYSKAFCSKLWKDVGLSPRELVGFCSNGTSVMTDVKNGSCGKVQTISLM